MNYIIEDKYIYFAFADKIFKEDKEDFLMLAEENYWEGDNLKDIIEKNINDIKLYYYKEIKNE